MLRPNIQEMTNTAFECEVVSLMTNRKIKDYGVGCSINFFQNHICHLLAEFISGDFLFQAGESTDDQSREFPKLPCPMQIRQHTIDIVPVFSDIFQKEDPASCIRIGRGTHTMLDDRQITADQQTRSFPQSVLGM